MNDIAKQVHNGDQVMGYRERIKKAATLEEANYLLMSAHGKVSEKAYRRCKIAYSQLPFAKAV